MNTIIQRLAQGATRLLVLALGLGLTATGWGAASLEETGGTVPTTATLAFKGASLSQVTADTLSGVIGGDWAGNIAGNAMTFNNFDRTSEASGTITCQAQIQHDTNVKGVLLTFTQDGSNVKVQKTGAKYIAGTVGSSIADGTDGYYDVNKLQLTLAKPVPLAVFDGASGGFKKSSVNGVTFAANGNTVAEDGSYVKISAAVGALFKLDTGYSYVIGEFTVTNLNEDASGERVLALWSPNNLGTGYTVGTVLKTGTVNTYGIWNSGGWNRDSGTQNSTLATGISVDASRTFALVAEDSKVNNVQNDTGTHLFELTGASPGTAVYGGTGNLGLRGDQTYQTLAIGGPATGSLAAMTGLVITKVVIYASNTRQFTSTDPTTIANVENPAAFYVGNGKTINASAINAGVKTSGSAYVYTEAGATINLDAELNGHAITFAGSISGVPGSADGLTLGSANDKVTLTDASYVPVIKGRGTVVYPDNTIPSSDSTGWLTSSDWAGTLSLNNIQGANNTQPGWYTPFHNYGSANSTIKVSGFTGFFGAGNFESSATLEIAAGSTFTLNNGNNGNSMTFAKLKGSGDIVICGNNSPAIQYVMRDASEFAGNITVSQSGTLKKSIVLGGGSSYNYNVNNYQKQICVLGNVTIAAGKTWTADNGIVVNGTLTKADSTATLSGTITGSGKIIYNDELPNSADFTANTWTGTVEVNGGAATAAGIVAADAAQFMNSSSKFTVASGTVTLGTIEGLTGKVNVKSGATLQIVDGTTTTKYLTLAETSGNLNLVGCTALATLTLDLGRNRDSSIVYPSSLKTLQLILDENLADDTELTFNVGNGTTLEAATVTVYKPDGSTVNNTAAAKVSADGHSVKVSYSPTVDGSAAWCAYEFASNLNNSGSDTTSLSPDGSFSATTSVDGDGKLYTYSHPYRSITYPADGNWSAMVRCTVPKLKEALVISFGTNGGGIIGLAAGETPDTEMRVVQGIAGQSHYITNGIMPVLNGTTAQHVYVFTVKDNKTVKVYCDNELINTVNFDSAFSIGGGLQVGSIFGGIGYGLGRCWQGDSEYAKLSEADQKAARIDSLRLYKATLGANAIAQLSEEFPAVKLFEATISGGDNNAWGTLGWTGGDISTINSYSKAIITVEDDATLTLPESITAEELVFEIASGKTLTLVDAVGGTTLTLGFPLEVNGGALAYAAAASKTIAVNGTGKLKFASGTEITGSLSGTAKVEIANEDSIAVASSGSIANPLTGAGTVTYANYGSLPGALTFDNYWTGTVVLPSFTADGFIFDNYGKTGSTIALTGIVSGWINPNNTTVAAALRLDGAVNITAMSQRTYTFAEIDGEGNLSFATGGDQPTAVSVTKVAEGYTGKISSALETPVTIATLDRAAGQSTAGGTKLLSTSGNVVANALTVAGVAQQVGLCTAADGIYVACTVTIPEVANASATVTVGGVAATGSSPYTVDVGSNVEITWTPALGFRITAGATQTINAIAENVTATAPTVEANSVEFSNFTVEYLADFSKAATITATVTGDGAADATYTLTAGGKNYGGTYSNGTVTFTNITGANDTDLLIGDTLSYTISASGTTSGTSTQQTSTVGNVTPEWVQEDAENQGTTGTWEKPVTYSGTVAPITDNTYTPTKAGDGIVTLTTVVKFGGDADSEVQVGDDAQAAVRIQNSKFEVYGKATSQDDADWQTTEVAAVAETTYTVSLTINYTTGKFTVSVGGYSLGEYFLATSATKISAVAYKGTGEFTSLNGSFVSGDIPVSVESANDVAVSSEFISQYLDGKTVAQAAAALNPNATQELNPEAFAENGNGINYFTCYALGLDPEEDDDKLVVDVSTDENGNFVFTVKHPTFDKQGNITGYEAINAADNVQATVTYKYGTTAGSTTTEAELDEGGKISPSSMFNGLSGNVLYYKAVVSISAKK